MSSLPLLALAALSAGCGTATNNVWLTPIEGGQRVYGGVQVDCEILRDEFREGRESGPRLRTLLFASLDLPLSAVGDTLSLPYALWSGWPIERTDLPSLSPDPPDDG